MNKVVELFKASYDEVTKNITWPKFSELQNSSWLVLIASLIFALLVGAIDLVFKTAADAWYSSF
jgi:preprotein translocase subunit SecE